MPRSISPVDLGLQLRNNASPHLQRRRNIIGLTLLSCATLGVVGLYQVGIIKRLPSPRWRGFDAEKVNGSPTAYSIVATPDAFLGLASYAATACLAGLGPDERSRLYPWMTLAMTGKLFADSLVAAKLTSVEATRLRTFSLYSIVTAVCTWAAFSQAIPESVAALRHSRERDAI